jgi:hypothetical protein
MESYIEPSFETQKFLEKFQKVKQEFIEMFGGNERIERSEEEESKDELSG